MPEAAVAPRVFTIPPSAPFLPTLAEALLGGTLVPGFSRAADPLALADATILLPTRRAVRELKLILADALGGKAAILPRIRTLADADGDGDLLFADEDDLDVPPAIEGTERLLAMTRLVLGWTRLLGAQADRTRGQLFRVPASPSDAVHLAGDLLRLIDEVDGAGTDWATLKTLVPDAFAGYWQLTLAFLVIATEQWPAYLAERGLIEPTRRRDLLIERLAARLAASPPRGPIIAAGSTGSVPATTRLLKAIAQLDTGAVVLPGLDGDLDEEAWGVLDGEAPVPSHPQFGLKHLLGRLGITREDVVPLGGAPDAALRTRARLISEAMRPAGTTERWRAFAASADPEAISAALAGVSVMVAANETEEALGLAIALRDAIETPGAVAALVTPDRRLARRVTAELARFGIRVDDSAGTALDLTPPAVLARLVAEATLTGCPAAKLLALLKHPLAAFGLDHAAARGAARALELGVLRGPALAPGMASVAGECAARRAEAASGPYRWSRPKRNLSPNDWRDAEDLVARVAGALAPLEALRGDEEVALSVLVDAHVAALRAVATDDTGTDDRLFAGEAGEALAAFLAGLLAAAPGAIRIRPADYPRTFTALMAGRVVRPRGGLDPRVHIWGTLEARLMSVDRLVVGGLNEGTWPSVTRTDPWLSRPMRSAVALDPPERRVGLAAHDFAQALGAPQIVLSRAERQDGSPTVPSRWLQRLTAVAGPDATAAMAARGKRFLDWARVIDDGPRVKIERPEPKPPVEARPRGISVSQVETWIRDPYAVYARDILKLDEIDAAGDLPSYAERGTVVHGVFAEFAQTHAGPWDHSAHPILVEIGRRHFASLRAYPEIHALWWPRFQAMAAFVLAEFESPRAARTTKRHAEVSGAMELPTARGAFRLRCRADRIDVVDGKLAIIDFKTGFAPSDRQINALLAPQLPLEAAVAHAGGFTGVDPGMPEELIYIVLRGRDGGDKIAGFQPQGRTLGELVGEAMRRFAGLVAAYERPEQGYLSRARVMKERSFDGPFDHLARVKEWSVGEEGDE